MLQDQLFRKVALERLSSPEQLDSLMRVITPRSWLALAPLLGLLLLAVLWGWFGTIPTKVLAKCILLNPTGLQDVTSLSSGRVTEMRVRVGDSITAGQEIARVAQPELLDRVEQARQRLRELEAQALVIRSFAGQGSTLTAQAIAQQRQSLLGQQKAAEDRARLARERAGTLEKLLEQGLITRQSLLMTQQEEVAARLEAENIAAQIRQLSLRRLEGEKQGRNEVASIEAQIGEARRALASLEESKRQAVSVASPYAGRVVEIKVGPGMLVNQGSSLVTIEQPGAAGQGLEAVIYLAAADGKKVTRGMEAQVTPSTVRREEHGFMRASVDFVSEYPATQQSMMRLLQNETLVRELAGAAPPTEIRAPLQRADTRSGYRWSSTTGPSIDISAGTMCSAEIVVSRQRPVSLVIPILKKTLGVD